MNKKIIISIFILTYFSAFAQNRDVDLINASPNLRLKNANLSLYNLKGKVQSVINLVYEANEKFGKITKGKVITPMSFGANEDNFKMEFNIYGSIVLYTRFDENGKTSYNTIFEYNSENKKKEIKRINSNDITTLFEKFDYNNLNQLKAEYNQYWQKEETNFEYNYDQNGQLVNLSVNNGLDKLGYLYTYNYKNDKLFETITKTSDDKLIFRKKITYLKNNISQIIESNDNNVILKTITFKYDLRNNLINKLVSDNVNEKSLENIFKYNSNNDLIEEVSKSYKTKFIYEYDNQNNWISKIKYYNETPSYVINREIIYYN